MKFLTSGIFYHRLSGFLGLFTVAIAAFFLTGYFFNKPGLYTWPPTGTPVALPSAILFIALGAATYILSNRRVAAIGERLQTDEQRLATLEKKVKELPCAEPAGETKPCA